MKRSTEYIIGAILLIGAIMVTPKKKGKYKEDDINLLLPEFRLKIRELINNMKAKGFDPILHDTGRTLKEAAINVKKGVGTINSLHLYGAATDIISASQGWSNPEFFKVLFEESKKLNLTSGMTFSGDKKDPNHIQAIPVKYQTAFRKLTSPLARNIFLKKFYEGYYV